MIKHFKRVIRRLTPRELAARELADAELELLEALTAREYADSIVQYNEVRCARLRTFLSKQEAK